MRIERRRRSRSTPPRSRDRERDRGEYAVTGLGWASSRTNGRADYERLAAGAEYYGFDTVSVYGDLYFQPPVPALLAMARATSTIELGPACLNPYTMHPVEMAGQIAAARYGQQRSSLSRAWPGGSWLEPARDRPAPTPRRRWPRRLPSSPLS